MNPLTQVKNTQKITAREHAIGITDEGSWHAKYKDSAYVYVGGLPFDLTEGDVLAVFAQYGEIVDVNLVRDKTTGKSKGFAFLAYEDQRSTVLAVDNLNGARVVGRIIKVDHVGDYKRKLEEDEEEKQKKREERGVCYAFQRGECNRGADCKFSHDEERNANTGWGGGGVGRGDGGASWKHDQFDGSMKEASRRMNLSSTKRNDNGIGERDEKPRGVCYAFQRGECNRGDGCKFAHDEQKNTNTGRGGGGAGGAGWKHDQFDGSMREAGRRMNITNTVSTKRKENDIVELDEIPQRRDVDRGDREREDGHRKRDDDREDRGRDDVRRRRDGDREDRGRDDVQRRRDGDRQDRGLDEDRNESDRRARRDDYREGSYDRKDPRDEGGGRREDSRDDRTKDRRSKNDDERDRSRDVRKERERSDRGVDGRGERSVRSRR